MPDAEEVRLFARYSGAFHIRVPGAQVAECKLVGGDVEPCILVEATDELGQVVGRWLCYSIDFDGPTWMGQSVQEPCIVNGAILWLETVHPVTLYGRK